MPDMNIVVPPAGVPADRLTLGATDARAYGSDTTSPQGGSCSGPWCGFWCMAEE